MTRRLRRSGSCDRVPRRVASQRRRHRTRCERCRRRSDVLARRRLRSAVSPLALAGVSCWAPSGRRSTGAPPRQSCAACGCAGGPGVPGASVRRHARRCAVVQVARPNHSTDTPVPATRKITATRASRAVSSVSRVAICGREPSCWYTLRKASAVPACPHGGARHRSSAPPCAGEDLLDHWLFEEVPRPRLHLIRLVPA